MYAFTNAAPALSQSQRVFRGNIPHCEQLIHSFWSVSNADVDMVAFIVVVSFYARCGSRERPTPPHQVRLPIGRLSRQQSYLGLRRYDFPVRIRPGLSQTIMAQRDLRKGRCGRPFEQCTQFRVKSFAARFRKGAELMKRAHFRNSWSAYSTMGAALAQTVGEIRKPTVKRQRIALFSNLLISWR